MFVTAEYGKGKLVLLSVLDAEDTPAGLTLEDNPTLAAADVVLVSDEQAQTELAAEHVAFTSGSAKPQPGDTISGATSGSTAVVIGCLLSSGSWGAGTAAGTLWVEQASGAFQSENLDNDTTGGTNFATIAGDLTDAAIDSVGRTIGIGLTAAEMSCRQFNVELRDATATEEYLETFISGHTIGHPDAEYVTSSDGLLVKTTIAAVASQTDIDLTRGPADDGGIPAGSLVVITDQANSSQRTVVRATSFDQSDALRLQLSDTPGFTIAVGDIVEVLAVTPAIGLAGANLTEVGLTDGAITAAKIATDAITAAKIAANAITSSEIADGAITAAKLASNAITAAKIATDAITAAKIAANAIGASELAADAVTEIQSGLATAAALATVDGIVDAILIDTDTTIPALIAAIDTTVMPTSGEAFTVLLYMVDATDGYSPETGLTVSAQVDTDDGGFGASDNSVTEVGLGWYSLVLSASEMTGSRIVVQATATGARPCNRVIYTTASV